MKEKSLQNLLNKAEVIRHQPVQLRAGETSDYYADVKKVFGDPSILLEIARATIENMDPRTSFIAASGYGGIPYGTEMSQISGLPLTMVRDTEKEHGLKGLIDGYVPQPGEYATIVDDVFTSGSSLAHTAEVLVKMNTEIAGCHVVIARNDVSKFEYPVSYLFTPEDLL
jgi:orotate phosphoribosyltransferase